ncbi:MAG: cytochrome c maturation protein CcmE [Sedimentisphaerales bacterium]|jgi:cytochrome c-type biogenesis protein CcmE
MKTKVLVKILVGIFVIGGGLGYFIFQTIQSSYAYYFSVDEFSANESSMMDHSLRIAGRVKPGSVVRDLEAMNLSFILAGTKTEVPVIYKGVIPDNFTEDIDVVVEGRLDVDGTFKADTLLTRCESKYKAKVD